jgi:ElaB/YqjD/DUF883 family membrane-anchored ribosome-binding protein
MTNEITPMPLESRKEGFMKDVKDAVDSADAHLTDMTHSTAEGLASARSAAQDAMGDARSRFDDVRRRASHQAHCAADATQHYVRENPWQVLGGAAVAGFLLGFLITRR